MTSAELWEKYKPKLEAAKERDRREQSLILLQFPTKLGRFWLVPITIERLLTLEAIDHPFVAGGDASHEDVLNFLWICSPDYVAHDSIASSKFFKTVNESDYAKIAEGVEEYLEQEFNSEEAEKTGATRKAPPSDWAVQLVDALASQYGWDQKTILELPIRRAFAYGAAIATRLNGNKQVTFHSHADKVKHQYLVEMERRRESPDGE